jgi:hypothetical protein
MAKRNYWDQLQRGYSYLYCSPGGGGGKLVYTTDGYLTDCLCGLVVTVPAYKSRGPGFDYQLYQIF